MNAAQQALSDAERMAEIAAEHVPYEAQAAGISWVECEECFEPWPCDRAFLLAQLSASLDTAWDEAEAALPEGWSIDRLARVWGEGLWRVWVNHGDGSLMSVTGAGDSPVACLHALALALRAGATS